MGLLMMTKEILCILYDTQRNANNVLQLNVGTVHTVQSGREHVTRVTV